MFEDNSENEACTHSYYCSSCESRDSSLDDFYMMHTRAVDFIEYRLKDERLGELEEWSLKYLNYLLKAPRYEAK